MPELPEVETLKLQLRQVISGAKIIQATMLDEKLSLPSCLVGRTVVSLARVGKGLCIGLDDGSAVLLHLRMTGRLLWQNDHPFAQPHTRFSIIFDRGWLDLIDPRRFATLRVKKKDDCHTAAADLQENSSVSLMAEKGKIRKLPIKSFLMDQRFVAGIGNIYACEILYAASISPLRRTCDVTLSEWQVLVDRAKAILHQAIACRGTTVSDWRDLFGQKGEYQNYLKVYRRKGEPCFRCGAAIERLKVAGRGTYYCPSCQK